MIGVAMFLSFGLFGGEPAAQSSATTNSMLRVLLLPFENGTGDTNWDDWREALPVLARSNMRGALRISLAGREYAQESLRRQGWTAGVAITTNSARQLALDTRAGIAVWGKFQREKKQWIAELQLLNTNSTGVPEQIRVVSPDLGRLPELCALELLRSLGRSISDADRSDNQKRVSVAGPALNLMAHAISLDAQDAPVAEREKVLHELLAKDPKCSVGYSLLIEIYVVANRTNELKQLIRDYVRECPEICDAHIEYGWVLSDSHDEMAIKRECLEALRLHRGCPGACRALFRLMGGYLQQWDELAEILEKAHKVRPDEVDNTILLAFAQAQCGRREAARALLSEVTDLPDEDETVDSALLGAALATQRYELAGRELTRLGPQSVTNEFISGVLSTVFITNAETSASSLLVQPRVYSAAELSAELDRRLSTAERKLVINPVEITPAISAEARRLTVGLTNDLLQSVALFAEVASHGRGNGDAGARTAGQTFESADDPQATFSCQEYAKLFVAMARSLGIESWMVHVVRDAEGLPGYHDCAVVFVNGNGILVDPTWRMIGIQHDQVSVLDDVQAISHQAMQLHGSVDAQRLRMGLKLNPDDLWTQLQFVRGMIRANNLTDADEEFVKVRQSGAETWDVYEVAGELDISHKEWEPAIRNLEKAVSLCPSNATVHFQFSRAYQGLEDHAKATEHLDMALQLEHGEMSKADKREMAAAVGTMKTILRSTAGDEAARAEMQRLAEAGDANALIGMAKACFDSEPQRVEEGMKWLLKAAQLGNAQAQYDYARNLSLMHDHADQEVIKWLTESARRGCIEAQYRLGKSLYEGEIVPRDNVAAGQWIFLAARGGNKDAKYLWEEMKLFLSPGELAKASKAADAFKAATDQSFEGKQ